LEEKEFRILQKEPEKLIPSFKPKLNPFSLQLMADKTGFT
jgi:hypothetical protein